MRHSEQVYRRMRSRATTLPVALTDFRGCNVSDAPENLPNSVGQKCINFYFDDGKLYPRRGSTSWGGAVANKEANLGIHATSINGTDYVFACYRESTGNQAEIWRITSGGAVAEGTGFTDSASPQIPSFTQMGSYPLWGNGWGNYFYDIDDNVWVQHHVSYPGTALTDAPTGAAGTGELNGTYEYVYIYVDILRNNARSKPGPVSNGATADRQDIALSGIVAPSDYGTRHVVWIYRKGGDSPDQFKFVTELTSGSTFTDDVTDANLGDVLVEDNEPWPFCRYVCSHNGRLLGAYSKIEHGGVTRDEFDVLYISYLDEWWRCPLVTNIDDPNDGARIQVNNVRGTEITGLASFGDYGVVFTRQSLMLLSGDDPVSFKLTEMFPTGCVSHQSIRQVGGYLVWLGERDVWAWDGSGHPIIISNPVRSVIREWTNAEKLVAQSFTSDNRYHILCGDEEWFCDFRQSGVSEQGQLWAWGEISGRGMTHVATLGSPAQNEVLYGLYSSRVVYTLENANTDASGNNITVTFKTKSFSLHTQNHHVGVSLIRRLRIVTDTYVGEATTPVNREQITVYHRMENSEDGTVNYVFSINDTPDSNDKTRSQYLDGSHEGQAEWHSLELVGYLHVGDLDFYPRFHPIVHSIQADMQRVREWE